MRPISAGTPFEPFLTPKRPGGPRGRDTLRGPAYSLFVPHSKSSGGGLGRTGLRGPDLGPLAESKSTWLQRET